MGRLQYLTIAAAAAIGLALTASEPAHAAFLNICDSSLCGATWDTLIFNVNGFEAGFEVNGTRIQIGVNKPVGFPVTKIGDDIEPFNNAAQIFFSGMWVLPMHPLTPQNQTIFFIKQPERPPSHIISSVLQYTYDEAVATGHITGFVISFIGGYDTLIFGPLPFQPTAEFPETANFFFSNTSITASLQSDVSLAPIPEPASLALFAGTSLLLFAVARRDKCERKISDRPGS